MPRANLQRLIESPKSPGVAILTGLLLAVVWANSPFAASYEAIHDAPASVSIGAFTIAKPMISWINEGLMVFFFFLVGLELKRETFEGGLSSPALMALPAAAAIGGMVVPVAIYLLITAGDPGSSQGWAIPAATDIVLALSLLALLGERAPRALVVFLTALAVFDDLGALIIIAGFYTDSLSATALLAAALGICGLIGLNRLGVARIAPYLLTGVLVWVAVLKSGVHATLAGVVIAWCIPLKVGDRPVLKRIEHDLRPGVSLLVIPVFAFFNAGITFSGIKCGGIAPTGLAWGHRRPVRRQTAWRLRRRSTRRRVAARPTSGGYDLEPGLRRRDPGRRRLHHEPVHRRPRLPAARHDSEIQRQHRCRLGAVGVRGHDRAGQILPIAHDAAIGTQLITMMSGLSGWTHGVRNVALLGCTNVLPRHQQPTARSAAGTARYGSQCPRRGRSWGRRSKSRGCRYLPGHRWRRRKSGTVARRFVWFESHSHPHLLSPRRDHLVLQRDRAIADCVALPHRAQPGKPAPRFLPAPAPATVAHGLIPIR